MVTRRPPRSTKPASLSAARSRATILGPQVVIAEDEEFAQPGLDRRQNFASASRCKRRRRRRRRSGRSGRAWPGSSAARPRENNRDRSGRSGANRTSGRSKARPATATSAAADGELRNVQLPKLVAGHAAQQSPPAGHRQEPCPAASAMSIAWYGFESNAGRQGPRCASARQPSAECAPAP